MSWNLAARVQRLGEQAERLLDLGGSVLCLQELTPTTLPMWREQLKAAGYLAVEHPEPAPGGGRRPLYVMTACTQSARPVAVANVPWPERVLALAMEDGTEVVNVHSPISAKPDLAKIRTHRTVYEHLAHSQEGARILCGDLNTPRREHPDGSVWP